MSNDTPVDLGTFLDMEIDNLPDAPKREILPSGKHVVQVKDSGIKDIGDKKMIVISVAHVLTEELANPADELPKPGTTYDMLFSASDSGMGALKELLMPIRPKGTKTAELLQALPGQQFRLVSVTRKYKDKNSGEQKVGWNPVGGFQFLSPQA